MKIDKNNYEIYALDYIEGTLSESDREEFERFLSENPFVADQIGELLVHFPLFTPDMSVTYGNKRDLIKPPLSFKVWFLRISAFAASVAILGITAVLFLRPSAISQIEPVMVSQIPLKESEIDSVHKDEPSVSSVDLEKAQNTTRKTIAENKRSTAKTENNLPSADFQYEVPDTLASNETPELPELNVPDPLQNEIEESIAPGLSDIPLEETESHGDYYAETDYLYPEEIGWENTQYHFIAEEIDIEYGVPFAETDNEDTILRSIFRRGGLRRLAGGIIAPLTEISPITVYNDNEERVVEFASIPISRKSNKFE